MNRKLQLFFTLRRLPPEYLDVERLTLRFAVAAMVLLPPIMFPGRHYVLYPVCGMLIASVGRLIGFMQHDSAIAKPQQLDPVPQQGTLLGMLLVAGVAVILGSTLYWAWTTRAPTFMMQSFFGAATLAYCVGRTWPPTRLAMGSLNFLLLAAALAFYLEFFRIGFLAASAYAALITWHFLFRKSHPRLDQPPQELANE